MYSLNINACSRIGATLDRQIEQEFFSKEQGIEHNNSYSNRICQSSTKYMTKVVNRYGILNFIDQIHQKEDMVKKLQFNNDKLDQEKIRNQVLYSPKLNKPHLNPLLGKTSHEVGLQTILK